jgi:hypothetical protein
VGLLGHDIVPADFEPGKIHQIGKRKVLHVVNLVLYDWMAKNGW